MQSCRKPKHFKRRWPSRGSSLCEDQRVRKTTILQWLAVNASRRTLPPGFRRLAGRVPFMLRLRNFADSPLPRADELGTASTTAVLLSEPQNWLQSVAKRKAALLLVDGVDEFPESRRGELVTWLRNLYRTLDEPIVVVTGRSTVDGSAAAIAAELAGVWSEFDIQPMDRDDTRSFVVHWHKATTVGGRSTTHVQDAIRVANVLSGAREFRLLASTPLLCAALCALFYVRDGFVPSSRIDVYANPASASSCSERLSTQGLGRPIPS